MAVVGATRRPRLQPRYFLLFCPSLTRGCKSCTRSMPSWVVLAQQCRGRYIDFLFTQFNFYTFSRCNVHSWVCFRTPHRSLLMWAGRCSAPPRPRCALNSHSSRVCFLGDFRWNQTQRGITSSTGHPSGLLAYLITCARENLRSTL